MKGNLERGGTASDSYTTATPLHRSSCHDAGPPEAALLPPAHPPTRPPVTHPTHLEVCCLAARQQVQLLGKVDHLARLVGIGVDA